MTYTAMYLGPRAPLGRPRSIGSGAWSKTAGKNPAASASRPSREPLVGSPPLSLRRTSPPFFRPGPLIVACVAPFPNADGAATTTERTATQMMNRRFLMPSLRARRGAGSGLRARRSRGAHERGLEVGDQVVGRLEAHRQADEARRRGERPLRCRGVRHPRRVLDEALDAAERLRELPDLRARDEPDRLLLRLGEEGDHAAEVGHLPRGDLVAGMARQAGVEHPLDARVGVEELRDRACVLAVPAHADG